MIEETLIKTAACIYLILVFLGCCLGTNYASKTVLKPGSSVLVNIIQRIMGMIFGWAVATCVFIIGLFFVLSVTAAMSALLA